MTLHIEASNLISNLFPPTLFHDMENELTVNWSEEDWELFLRCLLSDNDSTILIWNQSCRDELLEFINVFIKGYELFSKDKLKITALYCDAIKSNSNKNEENMIKYSFYSVNHKEMKLEYKTLKSFYYVSKYYLAKLVNENKEPTPTLKEEIEYPKKLWNNLIDELKCVSEEWKQILLIKTMILIYKQYYKLIGEIKIYEFLLKYFETTQNKDVKFFVIQFFFVTCTIKESNYNITNIKNFINFGGGEKIIDLIPELITREKLCDGLKQFEWESFRINSNKYTNNSSFLDGKSEIMEETNKSSMKIDNNFINYTNYICMDESWNNADKDIKICTLIIRLLKIVLKKFFSRSNKEESPKIFFPVQKIKLLALEEENLSKLIIILLCNNENLNLELIDFFIVLMNDQLGFKKGVMNSSITDFLVFYMMKYKSKTIIEFLDKIHYFDKMFSNLSTLVKSLTENEQIFINQYPNSNNLLIRYFPVNLIYLYNTKGFTDFINTIYSDNISIPDLIWNQGMLKELIDSFHFRISQYFKQYIYYISNNDGGENQKLSVKLFKMDEYIMKYSCLSERTICFMYYLDIYAKFKVIDEETEEIKKKNYSIDDKHIPILRKLIVTKLVEIKESCNNSNVLSDSRVIVFLKCLLNMLKR